MQAAWFDAQQATKSGDLDLLKHLCKEKGGSLLHQRDAQTGDTLAHLAARHDQVSVLEHLHKNHVPLDTPNSLGHTPMFCAARDGKSKAALFLHGCLEPTHFQKILSKAGTPQVSAGRGMDGPG